MRGSQGLIASFSLLHARSSSFPRPLINNWLRSLSCHQHYPVLATPRGPTPLPRDCPRRGTHTSLVPSLTPSCEVLWFSSPPCIAWSVSIAYPKNVPCQTEPPRQGISAGPFCSSTRRSKSRPVCLTNARHWRPMRGSQVLLASFSLTHARSSGFPRPP